MSWNNKSHKNKPHRPRMTEEEFKEYQAWKSEEKDRLKGLKAEAKAQGIPLDKVKQYWYKSKHYSINVKGEGSKTLEEIKQEILDEIKLDGESIEKDLSLVYSSLLDIEIVSTFELSNLNNWIEDINKLS